MVLPSISEMGDQRWRTLLDSHEDLARQIIEKHRGSLVKRTGEGILAVFDGPSRAVINSPMLPNMKKNADGSLTLYIQNKSPGADKEPNWLPAPNDVIYLVMRLYWPKTEPPSILPPGEGTWKPPGVKRAA